MSSHSGLWDSDLGLICRVEVILGLDLVGVTATCVEATTVAKHGRQIDLMGNVPNNLCVIASVLTSWIPMNLSIWAPMCWSTHTSCVVKTSTYIMPYVISLGGSRPSGASINSCIPGWYSEFLGVLHFNLDKSRNVTDKARCWVLQPAEQR